MATSNIRGIESRVDPFNEVAGCCSGSKCAVNAISPVNFRDQEPKFVTRYEAKTPKAYGFGEHICGAMIFLASDMSQYVTGENISVSGGWGI